MMENDMSAKVRLQALEAQLRERGVVDVKFFFDHGTKGVTGVANDVIDVLEAYLHGRFDAAQPIADSYRQ
jgi:hypothetical protein